MVVGKDAAGARATLMHFAKQIGTDLTADRASVGQRGFTDFILRDQ
jgi:hypothetical protein